MDLRDSNDDDGDFFSDVLDGCTGKDPLEPSSSSSILCDPEPVPDEPGFSPSQPPSGTLSSATTIRSRPIRCGSSGKESKDTSSKMKNVVGTRDSTQGRFISLPAPCGVREENNDESTITTAANDDPAGDSADSAVKLGDISSNLFKLIARFFINLIGFQINLFIRIITFPTSFLYHSFMFYIDPFRKFRVAKIVILWIWPRVWGVVRGRVSPSLFRWLKDRMSIWKIALRYGWGFLWLIYICCILLVLLVSSLVISGIMLKYLSEKPIMKREILNFDYTKQSPVAYVPLISCSSVGAGNNLEENMANGERMGERVIPTKRRVQVIISLLVPMSEYNKNLGVFQVRVDFLSFDGKIMASSSMPYMLRFKSGAIRLISSFLKIAPLITGYSETQTLNVKMKDFTERDEPTSCLKVTLERRAAVLPGSGIPELYDAYLVLESEVPFLKWITWQWKKTIYVWITTMTFMMELLFVLVCCRPIIIPIKRRRGGPACSTAEQSKSNLRTQR